ncbi:hypothetical protein U9M48_025592 [Paspalum notatum var. saurae]|uniref:Uncharacterized protein n=1 Tax=Paspalum notatum var. saurae TaxID=547442 RepID=A0AAQ3TTJ5_PASNO
MDRQLLVVLTAAAACIATLAAAAPAAPEAAFLGFLRRRRSPRSCLAAGAAAPSELAPCSDPRLPRAVAGGPRILLASLREGMYGPATTPRQAQLLLLRYC